MARPSGASRQAPADNLEEQRPYYEHRRMLSKLGAKKADLADAEEVGRRTEVYFTLCERHGVKPTMPGLALSLGVSIGEMATCPTRVLMRAMQAIEDITVQMVEDGRIPQAPAIFLLKNWFGYKDVSETSVRVHHVATTTEEIEARYARVESVESGDEKRKKRGSVGGGRRRGALGVGASS